jgi:hypothetical protein
MISMSRAKVIDVSRGCPTKRSSTRRLRRRPELNTFLFAPQGHHQRRQGEYHKRGQSHRVGVTCMLGERRLNVGDGTGQKHATLVRESGKESAHGVWGQFRKVCRNDPPRSLHHELNYKRSDDEQGQ